jgi:5-methylthioadenosine/S-adenosylhomocysteine deaminase
VRGPQMRWRRETVRPAEQRALSPDFVRDGTQLAIAEMLRAGITSFADMSTFPEEAARAASSARMRAAIGLPVTDVPSVWADTATAYFAKAEQLWDEYKSDPWVCLYFAPQEANEISDETLVHVRRVADELDARVAMPVHESDDEVQDSLAIHGRRPLQRLQELGLLRPGFTAVHLNCLDEEDLELIVRTGICVIACPQSDLRLGSGTCPVRRLDIQQVGVGLGTSDAASAGALDILAEARVATLIANGDGTSALSAEDALRMATLGGANSLGLGSVTGSIEPGKAADLVCWDLGTLASRFTAESASEPATASPGLADCILFGTTRQQASDVWTSGRAALSGRQLLAFDEEELAALARKWAQRLRMGAGS